MFAMEDILRSDLMSINSLTTEQLMGKLPFSQNSFRGRVYESYSSTAETGNTIEEAGVTSAIDALFKYIPTESITLYVATISALPALGKVWIVINAWHVYWFYIILTPILVILIYISKYKQKHHKIPSISVLPWWPLISATVAFAVWALAVPGNPYIDGEQQGVLAGLGALFCSTIFSILEGIFGKRQL